MNKLLVSILAASFIFYFCTFAATIKLKTGEVVSGTILERSDDHVKLDFNGTVLTYDAADIENIVDAANAVESTPAADDFQKGLGFVAQGSFWEAIGAFRSHLKDHPDNFAACYNLAGAYFSLGKFDDSITWYEKALRLKQGDTDTLIGLGISFRFSLQYDKAIEALKEAVKNSHGNARALTELALTYQSTEDFKSAAMWYERALETNPQDPEVHNLLGMVYSIMGDYDKSEEELRAAIKIDPGYADAYLSLGTMLIARQKKTGTGGGFVQARDNLNIARSFYEKISDNKNVERIDDLLKNIDN